MKKLIICMLAVLGICACTNKEKVEYIQQLDGYLVSQKIDGKLKHGFVLIDTVIHETYAKKGDYKLKDETFDVFGDQHIIKEKWIGKNKLRQTEIIRKTLLETKYDSISLVLHLNHPFWQTLRDGKKELYTINGKLLLDGSQPKKIISLGEYPYGHYFVRDISPVNLITTDNGCYLLCGDNQFGPYQIIFPGVSGYFFQENNKFGFCADQYNRTIDNGVYKVKDFSNGKILPPVFDAIIEVYEWGDNKSYIFLGLQDGKWQAFNQYGKKISLPASKVKLYTSLKPEKQPMHHMETKRKGSIHRYGQPEISVLIIY